MAELYGNTEGLQSALTLIQSKAAGGGSLPADNVTGSGTSGYLAKFNGANTITNGPALGTATTTFLRNDGSWAAPTDPKVTQTVQSATATSTTAYPILLSATAASTTTTQTTTALRPLRITGTPSGIVTAVTYNAVSDARLKENFKEFKTNKSILDLPIYHYDFIDGTKNQIGCKAQDLQVICPEIVHENEEGYLSIQESKIVYLLIEEIKQLKKEIAELKGE